MSESRKMDDQERKRERERHVPVVMDLEELLSVFHARLDADDPVVQLEGAVRKGLEEELRVAVIENIPPVGRDQDEGKRIRERRS